MFQLGMVVQQRIPMTNIYDTPEGIFGSPIRHQNHQNSENLLKRCLEWCYKALYCRGQQVLNTPCPAPFIAPSKSMIQKTIQQKISKNNKPHFKLSAHKHTHTHRNTSHDNKFAAVLLVLQSLQFTLFSRASSGLWECFPGTKSARELISTCTNELKDDDVIQFL